VLVLRDMSRSSPNRNTILTGMTWNVNRNRNPNPSCNPNIIAPWSGLSPKSNGFFPGLCAAFPSNFAKIG